MVRRNAGGPGVTHGLDTSFLVAAEVACHADHTAARRQNVGPGIKRLIETGRLGRRGTDSTIAISEGPEDRA